jgi:hypothetical protein
MERPKTPPPSNLPLIFGLDLGQAQDYSALACVEQVQADEGKEFNVRHLHRWPLGTPYTTPEGEPNGVAEDLYELIEKANRPVILVLDATGCGRPVVDIFRKYGLGAKQIVPVTITAGSQATHAGGWWNVPKRDLAGAVAVGLEQRTLRIAPGLKLAPVLAQELSTFKVKVTAAGNETFEAWRERDHDDLVLAVALAGLGRLPGRQAAGNVGLEVSTMRVLPRETPGMINILSQVLRGFWRGLSRVAEWGRTAGSCRCGAPLFPVAGDGRLFCQLCGFPPDKPEAGWPEFCGSCGFHLPPPEGGYLFCPTCLSREEWPPRTRAPGPRRGEKRRRLKTFGT